MQFALLNFLIGLPGANAVAAGAGNGQSQQGGDAQLFADLLGDAGVAGGETAADGGQGGGELAHELVANLTVAQDEGQVTYDEADYVTQLQNLLSRKVSPERARELLDEFHANADGQQPPEGLQEILESVEAGGEPVTVQDILAQVANSQPEEAPEQRAGTLQRALQWLQHALNPQAASMEALAAANAASMFPDAEAVEIATAQQRGEEERETIDAGEAGLMAAAARTALPEIELPKVDMIPAETETAAPVDDAPILIATLRNQPAAAPQQHAPGKAASAPDVMDAFVQDLGDSTMNATDMSDMANHETSETQNQLVGSTAQQRVETNIRVNEQARVHHAHFAYQRSEVMEQVQVSVRQAFKDGVDRVTIQLNPHELGRVEVKMDIVADGMSQISFLVEKQETFDLLQRDARTLERMLQDAGVKADAGSMEFNLRQENQSHEPWAEADGEDSTNDTTEISANPSRDLPTATYVHLVSDRLDITA